MRQTAKPGATVPNQEDHQRGDAPSTRCSTASSRPIRCISSASTGSPRAIVARDGPRPGKVGLVIGGGSGHEPTFVGFVGRGLADAAAVGNVFASPPPDPILDCTRAVSGGAGVLYMYGNYAGDVMNFDMAAEMAAMEDIEVRTVLTTDDVASAPRDRRAEPARGRRQLLHLQGGGRGLRPDAAARRGRADRAEGERPDLHHGRGARALLAAADAAAELRDRRGRDGDRHGHPRRAGRRPRAAASPPTRSSTRCGPRSSPRWRRRAGTGWRCWSTGWARRR